MLKAPMRLSQLGAAMCLALAGTCPAQGQNTIWINIHKKGDWGNHDYDSSRSPRLKAQACTSQHLGHVAVCWAPHCTYKSVTIEAPRSDANPGDVWVCARRPF